MCLLAETPSPSAAMLSLAHLLEELTRSLLCSSCAARKAQPGELLPSSIPPWAASCLLQNSFFPAIPYTFPNLQLQLRVSALAPAMGSVKEKGGKSQVRSVSRLLLLCQGKWFPASPVCLRKWAFLTTATFQGRCPCAFQLDHPSWLLCPMDLPKGCILEPLFHTNPAKLTVPFGSSGDCSPKGNITNKSLSKNGGMLFCIFSYYFLPPTQGKYWINSVYWGAGEKIRGVLI